MTILYFEPRPIVYDLGSVQNDNFIYISVILSLCHPGLDPGSRV